MPLRHAQLTALIGNIEIEISIFYQIVKLQLKHSTITRSTQNWFATAINPCAAERTEHSSTGMGARS
jgi:hypothetical protein